MSTDRFRPGRFRIVAGLTILALAAPACAGTLSDREAFELALEDAGNPDAGSPSSACPDVPTRILVPRCGLSGCHGTDPAAGLDLVSPNVRARLVGVAASGGPGVLIDPGGNPDASVLYLKLTPTPPFGSRMPLTGPTLDDTSMACVAGWIAETDGGAGTD